MNYLIKSWIMFIMFCGLNATLFSTISRGDALPTGPGARAVGMAGAYSAIADDATSVYWSPALLAWLPYTSDISLGLKLNDQSNMGQISYAHRLSTKVVFGIDIQTANFPNDYEDMILSAAGLAFGFKHKVFSAGLNLYIINNSTDDSGKVNCDLSAMIKPIGLEVAAIDLGQGDPHVRFSLGKSNIKIEEQQLAFVFQTEFSTAGNSNEAKATLSLGLEMLHYGLVNTRMGIIVNENQKNVTAGVGIKLKRLNIDYSIGRASDGELSHLFTVT